jgi:hypothetical protein
MNWKFFLFFGSYVQSGDITSVVVATVSEDGNRSPGREQGPVRGAGSVHYGVR